MPTPSRRGSRKTSSSTSRLAPDNCLPKMVAALEAGIPPDVTRVGAAQVALYRSQGHLLEVTDVVEKMQQSAGWSLPDLPQRRYA